MITQTLIVISVQKKNINKALILVISCIFFYTELINNFFIFSLIKKKKKSLCDHLDAKRERSFSTPTFLSSCYNEFDLKKNKLMQLNIFF